MAGFAKVVPQYVATAQTMTESVRGFAVGHLSAMTSDVSRPSERSSNGEAPTASGNRAVETPTPRDRAPVPVQVHQPSTLPLGLAERVLSLSVSHPLTTVIEWNWPG